MSNWKEEILSDHIGLRHGYQFRETDFTENGIQVIKIGNVTDDGLNLDATVSYVSSTRINEFANITLKDGDILMSLTGNIGRVVEVNNLGNLILFQNYRVGVFYPLNENIYKPFIKWILSSNDLLRQLNSHSNQSAQANFGKQDLDKLKFKIPSIPEQRQIAHILSTADAVIEKTQAAIAKYKAIKQGMLQDLFTRGINTTTGKLRPSQQDAPELYKESKLGWIPKEWEEDYLGNIISVSSGEGLTQNKIKPGHHAVYGGNGINGYHSEYLFEAEKLIIGRVGEYCGNAFITKPFSWVTDNALVVTNLEKEFNFDYWVAYLNFLNLNAFAFAAAQPVITGGIIGKIPFVKVPISEQTLIAERLNSLNQKLQTEQNILHKQQQIKAGLMNDLLSGKKNVIIKENQMA
jgi:type I restriction enzyme S subunit